MSDAVQPNDPNQVAPGAQKSPLDVLEELLQQSQNQAGGDPASQSAPARPVARQRPAPAGAPRPVAPTPAEDQAQADAAHDKKLADIQLQAQHKVEEDQVELAQKIVSLQSIKETPEYLARVQQDADKQQQDAKEENTTQGYQIDQLGHTKM